MLASQAKATAVGDGRAGRGEKPEELGCVAEPGLHSARVSSSADVNVAFQQSAHKVLLDDDNLLPLLHLTIEYHGKEHKGLPCFHVSSLLLLVAVSGRGVSLVVAVGGGAPEVLGGVKEGDGDVSHCLLASP